MVDDVVIYLFIMTEGGYWRALTFYFVCEGETRVGEVLFCFRLGID